MVNNDFSDCRHLLMLAIETSLEAGALIMECHASDDKGVRMKRDFTPVTLADRKASELIIGRLAASGLNVISEEAPAPDFKTRSKWTSFWIVDPIDGTREFINGGSEFSVNIGLVVGQETRLGVIYAPYTGELYYGCKSGGAFKQVLLGHTLGDNDIMKEQFRISPRSFPCDGLVVVVSKHHKDFRTSRLLRKLEVLFSDVRCVSRGSSLKFCMLAEGQADFFPRYMELKEWDTAAGQAIAEAAGCFVATANPVAGKVLYNKKRLNTPAHFVGQSEGLVNTIASFSSRAKKENPGKPGKE